jgi:hypothetical protein
MKRSAPEWTTLRLRVPRGYEDCWALIRVAHLANGSFTTSAIAAETNAQRQSVESYVRRLVAAEIAELVEQRRGEDGHRTNIYRLLRTPKQAPRVSAGGRERGATAQECLWRSMRSLKQFSLRELVYLSAVDRAIPLRTARRYLNVLVSAGYLTVHAPAPKKPGLYRLKPGMNTGPQPPSVLVTEAVWDRNLNKIVGDACATLQDGAA